MRRIRYLAVAVFILTGLHGILAGAQSQTPPAGQTPPRISFLEGPVSFWRPGAEDWVEARLNTPLAPGDALYAGNGAHLELQVGPRAFLRATDGSEVGLVNLEPNFVQFKVSAGQASLDLRALAAGRSVELDTPHAAFMIERQGYYRLEIAGDATHFITRRGGRATVIPAGGAARAVSPSEEMIVRGTVNPTVETYVAPEPDDWDRWNYARTDHAVEAVSARYIPPDVYGADALDQYGNWRVVPTYGSVWVPDGVASDWAPYTTGSWVWDPYYGWTWVDNAPWGWAPFHYGRWVYIDGFWAWAPGPVAVRPVYAPALVAFFFGGHNASVRLGIGTPFVSWVALGWGEPCIPWWGRPGFVGRPWWGGWGGPHVINNAVVARTAVMDVDRITFQNTRIASAVVTVGTDHFGRAPVRAARIAKPLPFRELHEAHELVAVRGALPVKPGPQSLVAGAGSAARPPQAIVGRQVVSTRAVRQARLPWLHAPARAASAPEARIVRPPQRSAVPARPNFGTEGNMERPRPPLPPRLEEMRTPAVQPSVPQERSGERAAPAYVVQPRPNMTPHGASETETRSAPLQVPRERPAPSGGERGHPAAPLPRPGMVAPHGVQEQEVRGVRREALPSAPHLMAPRTGAQPREGRSQEARPLPGNPANRLSPRRAGEMGKAQAH